MTTPSGTPSLEARLSDFEPSFEFTPAPPLPEEEFVERLRRLRREAAERELDVIVVHSDLIGWYHTSNSYLRYICDWAREGILIIPTDADASLDLFTIFSDSVLLPAPGEALLVDDIWQVGTWGREGLDRPGSGLVKAAEAAIARLTERGFARAQIGLIGDRTSSDYWAIVQEALPNADFSTANDIVNRMQRNRSPRERDIIRTAAQLISIGYEAACHVARPGATDFEVYAAFTLAQIARGGENGDGYQIGVNRYGTACGKPYGHVLRDGDLLNLYVSDVTYQGYFAQTARMIAIGQLTPKQEEVLEMCVDGVKRAEKLIAPGVAFRDLHDAAFDAYVERGYLADKATRTMPYNWSALDDGTPRPIPQQYVPDEDLEAKGRRLRHVYPATKGPHNPNLGHAIGMMKMPLFNVSSHNADRMEPGMAFVLHAQWLEPLQAGANIGDCYMVTEDGFENLSEHTPLEPFRVAV